MKLIRHLAALTIAVVIFAAPSTGEATILVYLSANGAGQGAPPTAPQETFEFSPGGGSFHIWVDTAEHLTGVSLDLETAGGAIRFTDATTHNPLSGGDTRWLPGLIRHGTVADSKISRIEGGALVGLSGSGRGIGPPTSGADALYEPAGGFLFATVDFVVETPLVSGSASLSIGHNLFGDTNGTATAPIFLGVGDGPVINSAGAEGTVLDLLLVPRTSQTADFDGNGRVGGEDLVAWQRGFGLTVGATRDDGDADASGSVDGADLGIWQSQFGTASATAAGARVPEPPCIVLALISTVAACGLADRTRLATAPISVILR